MKRRTWTAAATAVVATSVMGVASAAPVDPVYDTFSNLAGATFGGSGIPTNPTAITTRSEVTLGLTAFGRYCNAPLTNDGAGTFTAHAGVNDGLCAGSPHSLGTTWDFGYYVNLGTSNFGAVRVDLYYDLDPGVNTDFAALGRIDFDAAIAAAGGNPSSTSLVQDSQTLYSAFFSAGVLGVVFAPASAPFNPNVPGEYAFMLQLSDASGAVLGQSAILVDVVPEPATLALLGLGLAGLGFSRRKQ